MLVTENQLDEWVRGNAQNAQGVIVELVWRLVAASSPRPKDRRFPLSDSIGQPGPDGVLDVDFAFDPFVPDGRSLWDIGTSVTAGDKATSDYSDRVAATPKEVRAESVFVFVTPLSGRRDWPHTWKTDQQADWLKNRRQRNDWRDVRVIDGTKLIDWLHQFASVELWLAERMGLSISQIETPEQRWSILRGIGEPPRLTPKVFLVNRDAACAKVRDIFAGKAVELQLDTHFPDQVPDFVCACIADMDDESRVDAVSRCLVISGPEAWGQICAYRESHILLADFDLNDGGTGTKYLERARRAGHAVIYGGRPGGVPHPNREAIATPKIYQIKDALQASGYAEERARTLAQKSGGNLTTLLRCLRNLSLMPEWAQNTAAADLAIAQLLGSWNEGSEADRAIAEDLSGNAYGEWIATMRDVTLRPGTPLVHRDGTWRIVARYETWYALGPRLFDEHVDRLRASAIKVLRERDPRFDLPKEDRFAASIYGKVLSHSTALRRGLADSLALLGSHPKALTSCSVGKAESGAVLAVREILANADWVLWASLNDLLPLLAEAAPSEFLTAIETALESDPCPFDTVFAQEGSGITGWNYMTGVLWALETLAWDPDHVVRVAMVLGDLAARDPGGNWANRPAETLARIHLPWLPQTCAPLEKRKAALSALLAELPEIGWKVLMMLLPDTLQSSSESRRPEWRQTIPEDWSTRVTVKEYWAQVTAYFDLAIEAAKRDVTKLTSLVERLDDLPQPARDRLLEYLGSSTTMALPEQGRVTLWTKLVELVTKHRKFADAQWAMPPEQVNRVAVAADKLAPTSPALKHRRLFTERESELYEEQDNFELQRSRLEERQQRAVQDVFAAGGMRSVIDFAGAVEAPWRVGMATGAAIGENADRDVLPELLDTERKQLAQFAGGFIWSRFRSGRWQWVDSVTAIEWGRERLSQFLAYLPFTNGTWERVARLLGADEVLYWAKARANPYEAERDLEFAIDRLIAFGRPHAALWCIQKMRLQDRSFNAALAVRALIAAVSSQETMTTDGHELGEIIKTLQQNHAVNPDDLFRVEWMYLPILDHAHGASPVQLERRLASDPAFFCEVIRLVFRSQKEAQPTQPSEEMQKIATNAYRLLTRWRTPPGFLGGQEIDATAFASWLDSVKKMTAESGHFEPAMTIVGHVLAYAPPDQDGLWIHRVAAAALNSKDARGVREGFTTELFNSRGVHGFTGGEEERALARSYRSRAEAVDAAGFHRLGEAVRNLANTYEREAERESSQDPFED